MRTNIPNSNDKIDRNMDAHNTSPFTIVGGDIIMSGMENDFPMLPTQGHEVDVIDDTSQGSQAMDITSNEETESASISGLFIQESSPSVANRHMLTTPGASPPSEDTLVKPSVYITPSKPSMSELFPSPSLTPAKTFPEEPKALFPADDYDALLCTAEVWQAAIWRDDYMNDLALKKSGYTRVNRDYVLPSKPQGDLTGPLHPLVCRKNWIFKGLGSKAKTDKLWDTLQPTLRQVSRFLSEENTMLPWLPLMFGHVEVEQGGRNVLKYNMPSNPTAHIKAVLQRLRDMDGKVKFMFGAIRAKTAQEKEGEKAAEKAKMLQAGGGNGLVPKTSDDDGDDDEDEMEEFEKDDGQIHGIHFNPNEPFARKIYVQPEMMEDLKANANSHRIVLHAGYAQFWQQNQRPVIREMLTTFSLMGTIFHEISHAFYSEYNIAPQDMPVYEEPYYMDDKEVPEIGSAIERNTFGIPLRSIIDPKASNGVSIEACWVPTAWFGAKDVIVEHLSVVRVDVEWMHGFAMQSTWRNLQSHDVATPAGRQAIKECLRMPIRAWIESDGSRLVQKWLWSVDKDGVGYEKVRAKERNKLIWACVFQEMLEVCMRKRKAEKAVKDMMW
jgi:hypothetical protein